MITVKSLDFRYANSGKHAVNDMSFEIGKGEIFGFLGPSGAGKTTVQRLIIGLLRNYGGSIEVMGKERKSWNKDFFESIGVAFDFPNLFLKLSAGENLKLIGSYYRNKPADIKGLLDRVGLLPDINTRTENFSKGMKMRLNFVRAIMHQPELLFLDEPTSGLDPVNAHIIKEIILEEKRKGRTIFLTTHNMTVAEQLCDRVAFVNEGKIVATDSPKNLMVQFGKPKLKVEYQKDNLMFDQEFDLEGLGDNVAFQDLLRTSVIKTMHSAEATLEEIFIQLTGRNLL
ncbi:MAG: ABC transporter ATP-binding protein [Paludibacter sp.]|nr:ABC transporter ATP-binding protein [Paludibacter sp.]